MAQQFGRMAESAAAPRWVGVAGPQDRWVLSAIRVVNGAVARVAPLTVTSIYLIAVTVSEVLLEDAGPGVRSRGRVGVDGCS